MAKTIQYVTGLYLKSSFVWDKKKRIITSGISSILVECSLKCGVAFFDSNNFQGTFVDFRFLMKELQHESWSMSVKSSTGGCL